MPHTFRRICVYCGSSNHVDPVYFEAARTVGHLLADRGIGLVYGGGHVGLMGTIADAVLERGGEVIGVIPRKLQDLELAHTGCTELYVVDGMQPRKLIMSQLADGFITLPGGYGTLEELFETITGAQLNDHHKPVGLLTVGDYWDPLLAWLDGAVAARFVRPMHRDLLIADSSPEALLERMAAHTVPGLDGWIADP